MFKCLLLLSLTLSPLAAVAAPPALPLQANSPFPAQQAQVRSDLMGGEVYSEIADQDRVLVISALDRMTALIGDGSADALSPAAKVAFFNDQEVVNTILTKARRDSRLICRREKTVGSNMPTTQCLTAAQRDRLREGGAESLRSFRSSSANEGAK